MVLVGHLFPAFTIEDNSMTNILQSSQQFRPPVNDVLCTSGLHCRLTPVTSASLERAQWLAKAICPHEPALRRWLSRRTLTVDLDDIVQEAYARLALMPSVDHIHNPRAYFFRTAFAILVNEVRRAQIVPIDAVAELDRLEVEAPTPTPDVEAEGRQELRILAEAIAQLPPRCREVVILRKVQGFSQRETAQQLGIAESTVEKHIAAGLRHLLILMGGHDRSTGGKEGAQTSIMSTTREETHGDT